MGHDQRYDVEDLQAYSFHWAKLPEPVGKRLSHCCRQGTAYTNLADQQPGTNTSGAHVVWWED